MTFKNIHFLIYHKNNRLYNLNYITAYQNCINSKVKSYCLQIWVLSYVLKSLSLVPFGLKTVTTVSFSFVFTRELYNTHYTYFMVHSFYAFLAPPY